MLNHRNDTNVTATSEPQQIVNVRTGTGSCCKQCPTYADGFYTIEEHLRSFSGDPTLQYLASSWHTEKQEYIRQLATIPSTFAEYSLHDEKHSEKIITSIERLLGPQRIAFLSPGDAWLILQCAYTHDLGMCVSESEKYNFLTSQKEFMAGIQNLENQEVFETILSEVIDRKNHYTFTRSSDGVRVAAEYWNEHRDKLYNSDRFRREVLRDEFSLAGYFLNIVIMEYFRGKHAERSRDKLIERRQNTVERDLIPGHMREAVAQIDYYHCGPPKGLLALQRRQNGYNSGDFIHPRFVAALLRIGDLMDMETTRFNPYVIDGLANISKDNMSYMIKDLSVSEILVDQHTICVKSSFETKYVREFLNRHKAGIGQGPVSDEDVNKYIAKAIKHMRNWMNYIENNTLWIWGVWNEIAPDNFPGTMASAKEMVILLDGNECDENDMELRYEIDPRRAAQIIEGASMYRSPIVFLREIIQNAVDATKFQLFRNFLKENVYEPKKTETEKKEISFEDFLKKYEEELKESAVEVSINFNGENDEIDQMEVSITDKGMGITRKRLNTMRRIGAARELKLKNEANLIPEWLRPTAHFGIGMQSAFLVADRFTILTNPRETENNGADMQHSIRFSSTRLGGDISSIDTKVPVGGDERWEEPSLHAFPRGTRFIIKVDLKNPSDFIRSYIDSFDDKNLLYRVRLISILRDECKELLKRTFTEDIIPIKVKIDDSEEIAFDTVSFAKLDYDEKFPHLRFHAHDHDTDRGRVIYFWYDDEKDKDRFCALYKFTLSKEDDVKSTRLYFRGIRFSEKDQQLLTVVKLPGYDCEVNIMSGDANNWLEVNRDYVRKEAVETVCENLEKGISAFVDGMVTLVSEVKKRDDACKNDKTATKSKVSKHLWKVLKGSPDFAKTMLIHTVVNNVGKDMSVYEYIAGAVGGIVETALIDERCAEIAFVPEPITKKARLAARFIDFSEYEQQSRIALNVKDSRIVAAINERGMARADVNKAIRNSFTIWGDKKYKRIEAYKTSSSFQDGVVKIYELGNEINFTEIDKVSYSVIIKNIIEEYLSYEKEYGDDGFPVFPAPDLKWFNTEAMKTISLKKQPPGYRNLCDIRYASFVFAPFPIKHLKPKLEEIKNNGDGEKLIRELQKSDALMRQYYRQAIEYMKEYGRNFDGMEDKKIEEKILSAWGEYADFIGTLIKS